MSRKPVGPFEEIKGKLDQHYDEWVLRSFAGGPTFRMFDDFSVVRAFLDKHGPTLASPQSQKQFDHAILNIARKFQRSKIKASGKRRHSPTFGYAAKVLNLYVKHYGFSMPYFMGATKASQAKQLLSRAHVPLDRIVLEWIWKKDFRSHLKDIPELRNLRRIPHVNDLKEKQYRAIQKLLRVEATKAGLPPIAYDFRWMKKPK